MKLQVSDFGALCLQCHSPRTLVYTLFSTKTMTFAYTPKLWDQVYILRNSQGFGVYAFRCTCVEFGVYTKTLGLQIPMFLIMLLSDHCICNGKWHVALRPLYL